MLTRKMTTLHGFPLFPALPAELRLLVWEYAFSTPSHIAVVVATRKDQDIGTSYLPFSFWYDVNVSWTLKLTGPAAAPYRIGMSCKEAWHKMEETCVLADPWRLAFPPAQCWYNVDSTVFNIPFDDYPFEILRCLGSVLLSRVKYLTVNTATIERFSSHQHLDLFREVCPALRAIFLQPSPSVFEYGLTTKRMLLLDLSRCLKALNKEITTVPSKDVACQRWYLRSRLSSLLSDAPPGMRIVFLEPASHLENELA